MTSAKRFFVGPPSPKEAVALQRVWRERIACHGVVRKLRRVCGVDVAYDPIRNLAFAAAVMVEMPSLREVERSAASLPVVFPYIPGLLGFREAPVILKALAGLKLEPDLLLVDGQGIAHPRRCGIASMIGLSLDMPTIGCAKSLLVGEYSEPGQHPGDSADLVDRGEVIGMALRTRAHVRPVFVSVGHRVSLSFAVKMVMAATNGLRLPAPIHLADRLAAKSKAVL